jgi:hypothetical protein
VEIKSAFRLGTWPDGGRVAASAESIRAIVACEIQTQSGAALMSRMIWNARVILTGANGQSGTIDLSANNLVTIREIEQFLAKATKMASTLQATHMEEQEPASARQPFKVVG